MIQGYSFAVTLASSQRAAWKLDDVLGAEQELDFSRAFMPEALARTAQFPPLATQFVAVGEHSGELGSMLERLADIYERQSSETMKRLLALLVPALTIASAVVVAAVFGSILSALLSVYDLAR